METQTRENSLGQIKRDLESRAEKINEGCEREFIKISVSSILETSPVIDSYSTWLLAGCGAMASGRR